MASAEVRRIPGRALRDWGLVLMIVLAFKWYYAQVETVHLQWLLHPLAVLLNATSLFGFEPTGNGEWHDAGHGLVIVKACAGGNFLIASWLGWLWRWRTKGFDTGVLLRAFGAAWLTTLFANALRIVLIAYGQDGFSAITSLSAEDSHRLIGICVYFLCLWAQLAGRAALPVVVALYLGVALVLPGAHAWLTGRGGLDATYAAWTAAVPGTMLLAYGMWRRLVGGGGR